MQFPSTASVLQIAAICPLSNATVERFFSKLRHVATRLKKYGDDNIITLLFVGLECERDDNGIPERVMRSYVEAFLSKRRRNNYCTFETYLHCRDAIRHWRSGQKGERVNASTQCDPATIAASANVLIY